jgi:hypothetical protein
MNGVTQISETTIPINIGIFISDFLKWVRRHIIQVCAMIKVKKLIARYAPSKSNGLQEIMKREDDVDTLEFDDNRFAA